MSFPKNSPFFQSDEDKAKDKAFVEDYVAQPPPNYKFTPNQDNYQKARILLETAAAFAEAEDSHALSYIREAIDLL